MLQVEDKLHNFVAGLIATLPLTDMQPTLFIFFIIPMRACDGWGFHVSGTPCWKLEEGQKEKEKVGQRICDIENGLSEKESEDILSDFLKSEGIHIPILVAKSHAFA